MACPGHPGKLAAAPLHQPVLLHRETIGTACLSGAVVYLALDAIDLNEALVVAIAGLVVVVVRELSIKYNWNLPKVVKNP